MSKDQLSPSTQTLDLPLASRVLKDACEVSLPEILSSIGVAVEMGDDSPGRLVDIVGCVACQHAEKTWLLTSSSH